MATAKAPAARVREEIEGLSTLRQALPPKVKFDLPGKDDDAQEFYGIGEWAELVVESAREIQARDYRTKELLFYPKSGDPIIELVLSGVTTRDGIEQTLWVSGKRMKDALHAALKGAGVTGIAAGDMVRVCWTGEEETVQQANSREKLSATKLYAFEIRV